MTLTFTSHVPNDTIWVTYAYLDTDCDGNFRKEGWYEVPSGGSTDVWSGDCAWLNSYWYFYAESNNGLVWSGSVADIRVTNNAFNQCIWDDSGDDRTVGLIEIDLDSNWSCTVDLWGPSGPPPSGDGGGDSWGDGGDDGDDGDDGGDDGGDTGGDGWGDGGGDGGGDDGGGDF